MHTDAQSDSQNLKRLTLVALIVLPFGIVELMAGLWSGSLALIADALHMGFDFLALTLSIVAILIGRLNSTRSYSFGYHRAQVLAAFVNGLLIVAIALWIFVEALQRITEPITVIPLPVLLVGIVGLVVNIFGYALLSHSNNLNLRAVAVHVLGDLLGSIAVITSAVLIWLFDWTYIDPVLSIAISVFLLRSAYFVLKDASHILLEGTPHQVDVSQVRGALIDQIEPVLNVHHVHIWSLTLERRMVTLHVEVKPNVDHDQVLMQAKKLLADSFDLAHSTIQIEIGDCPDELDTDQSESAGCEISIPLTLERQGSH